MIENILNKMRNIPIGNEIIGWASEHNIKIEFQNQDDEGKYHPDTNIITLSPEYSDNELMVALAHELRHAWQDKQVDLQKYQGNIYAEIVFRNFAEADAFSFHNSFAIVASGALEDNSFLAKIDSSYISIINEVLGQDSQDSSVENLRAKLFEQYFIGEHSIRLVYEEGYFLHLKENLEHIKTMSGIFEQEDVIKLEKSDLHHFGKTDFNQDSSNYLDRLDILTNDYLGFKYTGLDEIVDKYSDISNHKNIRDLI